MPSGIIEEAVTFHGKEYFNLTEIKRNAFIQMGPSLAKASEKSSYLTLVSGCFEENDLRSLKTVKAEIWGRIKSRLFKSGY